MAHERRRDRLPRRCEVRPPKQQRSREAWNRVLDAGVAILEDGGYDAFTIAAVCERASVAPTAIYARTTSKDALFLAVYEHGIAQHPGRAGGLRRRRALGRAWLLPTLVRAAVAEMVGISLRHQRFLRAVVLDLRRPPGGRRRRGARYVHELGERLRRRRPAARATRSRTPTRRRAVRSLLRHGRSSTTIIRRRLRPGASPRRRPVDDDDVRRRPGGDRGALPARHRSRLRQLRALGEQDVQ